MVTRSPVVGVCGVGVMGFALAQRLAESGLRVVTSDPGARTRQGGVRRLAEAGIEDLDSLEQVVAEADLLLSVMGSQAAPVFAGQVAAAVRAAATDLVFAECNLIAPADMIQIAERLSEQGVRVVDAAIVGAPPAPGWAPCVYTAGPHAHELDLLAASGFDVRVVGERIGDASALKVCSAAVWQGALALVSEVARAAARYGLQEELLTDLRDHQRLIHDWFGPALEEAVPRAGRWAPDMEVVSRTLRAVGADGSFHEAAGRHYRGLRTIAEQEHRSVEDIVAALAALDWSGSDR